MGSTTDSKIDPLVYIRAIGHDVGAPLRHIRGFAALLDDEIGSELTDEPRLLLDQIRQSAELAEQMIYGVHDLAHLASGAEGVAIDSLAELFRLALAGSSFAAEDLVVDGDGSLISDSRLLKALCQRLAQNVQDHACKARLTIRIQLAGDLLEVSFEDKGPGIAEGDWEKALKPFNRLGKRPVPEHVGLGLTIANECAAQLGGTLALGAAGDARHAIRFTLPRRYSEPTR